MEFCSIVPCEHAELMYEQPYVMLLSHLTKNKHYVDVANNPKFKNTFKMNDNSVIELGSTVSLDVVLEAKNILNSTEIILRDCYPNGEATRKVIQEDLNYLRANNLHYNHIMGVCHGENEEEFIKTFNFLNAQPEITTIGIPKVITPWTPNHSRFDLFDIWSKTDKEIHFLGAWYNLSELKAPKAMRDSVRTIDTCLPFYYAITGKDIFEDREGTIDLEGHYELTDEIKCRYRDIMNYINSLLREV